MKKIYNIAIIGCGSISQNHISAILAAGEKITALCDIKPEKMKEKIEKFNLKDVHVYTDYRELLKNEAVDSVHICTPHDLHAEMSVAALNANIHVLCEKPLAISEKELEAILEAQKKSKATLGVCLQNRYEPTMKKLKTIPQETIQGACGIIAWKRDADYYSDDWHGTKAHEGGGVIINQALHTIDLLQWFCGMPDYVTAHVSNDHLKGVIEVEDTANALFETENGFRFNIYATNACGADFPAQVHIKTKDGTRYYADNTMITANGTPVPVDSDGLVGAGKAVWGTGHFRLISDFYHCLEEGTPFPISAEEGAKVVRMILGIYASNGEKIKLI